MTVPGRYLVRSEPHTRAFDDVGAIRDTVDVSEDSDPQLENARSRVGQTLRDKWKLERLIGVGGMAAVYSAVHRNGLKGAVKMLHPSLSRDRDAKERFLREGYAANKVEHPGVVRVLDDDEAQDGAVFLVMELLHGQTVDAMATARGGRLALEEVLAMADLLLDVLVAAHAKGIVHRDLKPENLFMTNDGHLKILDFGIARLKELQGSARATSTGTSMGTPAFMPPEQASGQWSLVDARTDLWAVGASMFTLLTDRTVHEAPTVQLVLAAAMTKPARSLASVAPSVPPSVCAVVDRALAFERNDRWPDARSMQNAVREARREPFTRLAPVSNIKLDPRISALESAVTAITAPEPTRPAAAFATAAPVGNAPDPAGASPRKSSRGVLAFGAIGLLALAGVGVTWAVHSAGSPHVTDATGVNASSTRDGPTRPTDDAELGASASISSSAPTVEPEVSSEASAALASEVRASAEPVASASPSASAEHHSPKRPITLPPDHRHPGIR